jgi:hypothetical protein
MNNRGTVTSAQIAGRAPKIGAKSAATPRTKPAPKPGIKRKRTEVEDRGEEGKEPSPRRLRSRIY